MANNSNDTEFRQQEKHIIRVKHNRENPYVTLNRGAARDPNLPLDTLGLWFKLMCRPDDWEINVVELTKSCKCGKEKVNRMLGELIKAGYAYRYQERVDGKRKNQFSSNVWYIFEFPMTKEEIQKMFPQTGFPFTEVPRTDNPQLQNSNESYIPKVSIERKSSEYTVPPLGGKKKNPSSLSDTTKKKPKVPFRTACPIERAQAHKHHAQFVEHFNSMLVGIDEQDHKELVQKHGESIVLKAYEALANWKISKAEAEPECLKGHTDIGRMRSWVIKQVIKNPDGIASGYKRSGKLAIAADKKVEAPEDRPKVYTESEFEYGMCRKTYFENIGKKVEEMSEFARELLQISKDKGYIKQFEAEGLTT
jgi:hypothetical protein